MGFIQKKYLITGGKGFIGRNIAKRLISQGHIVILFDNNYRGYKIKLSIHEYEGDVLNEQDLWEAAKKFDSRKVYSVIHCAAINGTENFYKDPGNVLRTGIKGTGNVINFCVGYGVKELIYFSSSEVYGQANIVPTPEDVQFQISDPTNPRFSYAGSKQAGELMCLHIAEPCLQKLTIVRPHNIYGNNMGNEHVIPQLTKKIIESKDQTVELKGDGYQTRAFCHIDDFVDGLMLLLSSGHPYETPEYGNDVIYNIGNPEIVTMRYLAYKIGDILGKNDFKLRIGPNVQGEPRMRCPDVTKLSNLGFKPKIMLHEGLKEVVEWYKNNL